MKNQIHDDADDDIYVDHFYMKSRGNLPVFRITYPDGSVVMWISRDEILDLLYATRLQKLQAKKKGR